MIKQIGILLALALITVTLWFAQFWYPSVYLVKGFYSSLAITLIYFLFKSVAEETIAQKIQEAKARYSFRKAISILYLLAIVLALFSIWIEHTETLLVSYGLVAAGVAIALQDFFKNFMGGVLIFATGIYRVGDRIELNQKCGDVVDIGILYTTLLELKEWVAGEQATGRLTVMPNGYVLSSAVNNYTKDNNFIWDEFEIPITYDSDWKEAIAVIRRIVGQETREMAERAEQEILKLAEKYYFPLKAVEPEIYVTLTDNWIALHIRYVTDVRQRRAVHNALGQQILEEIQKSTRIQVASTTLDIIGFPEVRVKQPGGMNS